MDNAEVGVEFERLMKADPNGLLRPEAVVEAAKDPNHILHNKFEWDDSEAASKYRVWQARELFKSYKVEVPELNIKVQALTSLDIDRSAGGGYRWTLQILEKPDLRGQLLQTAIRELDSVRTKYSHLQELSDLWDQIESKKQEVVA